MTVRNNFVYLHPTITKLLITQIDNYSIMSTIPKIAEEISHELASVHPTIRKTILKKLPLLVAVILAARTVNTMALAKLLPLTTLRNDMRLQWISRLLGNPLLLSSKIMEPFARRILAEIRASQSVIRLKMDQEILGERFIIVTVQVLLGDRALPLAWSVEDTSANLGFDRKRMMLEQITSWLPDGAPVRLLVDHTDYIDELLPWVQTHHWQYRFYLQEHVAMINNNVTDTILASDILLLNGNIKTNIGLWRNHELAVSRMVAMDCPPTEEALHELEQYHWIDATFSKFCTKGFSLKDTQLFYLIRIDHMVLIIALAMYWCHKKRYQNNHCQD